MTTFLDRKTGFIFGGNIYNCGTWMDKMGESSTAGNRGVPSTPRDGADIEIIGLLKSTVSWLDEMNKSSKYSFNGVKIDEEFFTYKEWSSAIKKNFEHHFYIPIDEKDDKLYNVDPKLIKQRGFYKDTLNSEKSENDYQLRPNQVYL